MSLPIALAALLLVGLVVALVSAPLRRAERAPAPDPGADAAAEEAAQELRQLEAAREAKYQEVRDAELDWRTGKLSPEDYAAVDGALRAEAIEILDRIEAAGGDAAEPADAPAGPPGEQP